MRLVKYLFYLTVLIFPLGQLMSLTAPAYPEVRIHLLDVLVGLTVGVWIAGRSLNVRRLYSTSDVVPRPFQKLKAKLFSYSKLSFLSQSLLVFIGVGVLSILVNIDNYKLQQLIVGSLYLVRFAAYIGLYFVVRDLLTLSKPGDLLRPPAGEAGKTPGFLLFAVGVSSAILGLFQFFLYPNLRNLQYLGWDPHLHRAFGTFLDPQFLGVILVLTLIVLIGRIGQNRTYKLMAIVVGVSLLLTYSRSSYLALAVGLGILALHHVGRRVRRLWKIRVIGVIGVIAVLLIFFRPKGIAGNLLRGETAISRIQSWKEAVEIWKEKPILGVGFNMYRYARIPISTSGDSVCSDPKVGRPISCDARLGSLPGVSHSAAGVDNSFLFVLATTGVIGFVAYLNIWRVLLGKITGSKLAIAAAVFTHALFNNTLFYPWVMWWVWVFYSSSGE